MSTKFDVKPKVMSAEGAFFTAQIQAGRHQFVVQLTWKTGYSGVAGFSARDEATMMKELTRLDSSVKFYKRDAANEVTKTREEQNVAMVEAMRVDPKVKDVAYFSAAKRLGVDIKPRPDFTGSSARTEIVSLIDQGTAWLSFAESHMDLTSGGFGAQNEKTIFKFLADEGLQVTPANLESAYQELKAASMFKAFDTGRLGGRLVRPYNHAELVENRKRKPADFGMPENLSPVDEKAWQLIHSRFPTLPTSLEAFKSKCSQQILAWAAINAKKEGFVEGTSEFQKRIDVICLGWAQQSNTKLGRGNKAAVDSRVWLG